MASNAKRSDLFKWLLIFIIFIGGIVANYHFNEVAWAIRAAVGIFIAAVLIGIVALTAKGQRAWDFIKGARTELRKVVWPTRQETLHTTLIVVAFVVITALILWGIDSLFLWLIGLLMGQRG